MAVAIGSACDWSRLGYVHHFMRCDLELARAKCVYGRKGAVLDWPCVCEAGGSDTDGLRLLAWQSWSTSVVSGTGVLCYECSILLG